VQYYSSAWFVGVKGEETLFVFALLCVMVVIEFDLPRSVSLSALDENNVTLKDSPENGGQESNKMVPRATLICRPNSHPFQVIYYSLWFICSLFT
jgi:hypothetical protein